MAGRHNVLNALAACAGTMATGTVTLAHVVEGLAAVRNVPGRLRGLPGVADATVYDDTYNANPGSVRAALDFLASLPGERWFVFGDMAELGPGSEAMHREIGDAAEWRETASDLIPMLRAGLNPQVTVLVKGSRSMGMEQVVEALAAQGHAAGAAH